MAGDETAVPDGIEEEHQRPYSGLRRHASPLALVLLTAVMAAALLGFAGSETTWRGAAGGASVELNGPQRIRNGEFFEWQIRVTGVEAIENLVIGIDAALWKDFTINSFVPTATEESSAEGELRFAFGPLPAGTDFLLKIDGQINPDHFGGNEGLVTVSDGEERLVELPIEIEVLP